MKLPNESWAEHEARCLRERAKTEAAPNPTPPTDLSRLLAEVERQKRVLANYSEPIRAIGGPILDTCDQLAAIVAQLQREREDLRTSRDHYVQLNTSILLKDQKLEAQLSAAQQRVEELEGPAFKPNYVMNAHERAEKLFKRAEKLGMEKPSEAMVAEAISDAECDALNFPHRVNALGKPSDFICEVKAAVGHLAEHAARDMDHYGLKHSKWYKSVERVRKYLQLEI